MVPQLATQSETVSTEEQSAIVMVPLFVAPEWVKALVHQSEHGMGEVRVGLSVRGTATVLVLLFVAPE